jgi:hypothetical protein
MRPLANRKRDIVRFPLVVGVFDALEKIDFERLADLVSSLDRLDNSDLSCGAYRPSMDAVSSKSVRLLSLDKRSETPLRH